MKDFGFILCRPECGLNDMLNQIELSCLYAASCNRIVLVDTNHVSCKHFCDDFDHYFESRDERLILNPARVNDKLDEMEVYPRFLAGRVNNYDIEFSKKYSCWVDTVTGLPVAINFNEVYSEKLLVHQQFGGGTSSINAIKRMAVRPWIAKMLKARIDYMNGPYCAIHIRNTDLKTDYNSVIQDLLKKEIPKLYLATDSLEVVRAFRKAFKNRVISFFDDDHENSTDVNEPLHYKNKNARKSNTDAILDLLTLAMSSELYLAPLMNCDWAKYSGFSALASLLKSNPSILNQFVPKI